MGAEQIFRSGVSVYFVGIKGTGVCALAELMHNSGLKISGSDTSEVFYTDDILKELNIPFHENFDADHINKENVNIVVHSAAYSADSNPELVRTRELDIPVLKYTDALGAWSAGFDSTGICGVHGKTTTTAICGVLMRAINLPAQILTGSASFDFSGKTSVNRSTLILGDKYFIAETCEYRRHFLSFHPSRVILTSVESDHQDYFPDYNSIRDAFVEYCRLIPNGGQLIYCADDPGASEVARIIESENRGIEPVPYGFTALGRYKLDSCDVKDGKAIFSLSGFSQEFVLRIPGNHTVLNAAAAIALAELLVKKEFGRDLNEKEIQSMKTALENFKSTKRRSEILGESRGILFMDDYAHHPTAIKKTLAGIKSFYPFRRLIVSFMPHTYTRTAALFDDFASAFEDADILFLHKIYGSARENYSGGINGKALFEKTVTLRSGETRYIDEPDGAFEPLCEILKDTDIFITLGAGNNWTLGEKLLVQFKSSETEVHHD